MYDFTLLLSDPRYRKSYLKKTELDCSEDNRDGRQRRQHERYRRDKRIAEAAEKKRSL